MYLNDICVQIIGLDRNYRGSALESVLNDMGMNYTRVIGVDGCASESNLDAYQEKKAKFFMHRGLTNGEIGCSLSHVNALRFFLSSGSQYSLIFEDDARINRIDLEKFLSSSFRCAIQSKPGAIQLYIPTYDDFFNYRKLKARISDAELIKNRFAPRTATAYIMNKSFAELALRDALEVYSVADWPIWSLNGEWYSSRYDPIYLDQEAENSSLSVERDKSKLQQLKILRVLLSFFGLRALYGSIIYRFNPLELYEYEVIRPIYLLIIKFRVKLFLK
jgi:hypothetical protein